MNKKRFLQLFFILLLSISQTPVHSCTCGTEVLGGLGIIGPIITMPAYTLPKGKFALGTGLQYVNYDQFSSSQLANFNRQKKHLHSYDSTLALYLNSAYAITDDFNLILSLPFNFKNDLKTTFDGFTIDQGDSVGIGDLNLLGKYRFYKSDKHGLHAAVLGGIKMPTGHTDERDEFGFKLGPDDQPGTGSWDPLMGLALSKQVGRLSLDTNTLYRLSTKGSQDTIVGDIVNFNAAVSYKINKDATNKFEQLFPKHFLGQNLHWGLVFEMNGRWQEKVEFAGIKDSSHGGLTIFLSPGFKLAVNDDFVANLSVALPVIQDLNGEQPESTVGLFFGINKIF